MPKHLTADKAEKQFLVEMLTVIPKEEESSDLLNKKLLIRLLTLKINQPDQFKELVGGYSSNTYHYEKENLVFRIPKPHNPLYRHTDIEIHNLSQAKLSELTPLKIVAYYAKYSLLITQFIPSYQSYSAADFKNPDKLIALAHLVKKLHYSQFEFKKNHENPISFIDSSSKTFQNIKSILSAEDKKILEKLDAIRSYLAKFKIKKRPSHGDLHHFNLIETNGIMQLMDWELSSVEDPAHDIARFFCVTGLNAKQKEIFLQSYQSSLNILLPEPEINNLITRIQLFEPLNYFSIVVWAKYAVSFFYDDKRQLFEETIKNYTEKTVSTLQKIDLPPSSNPEAYIERNYVSPSKDFSLFRLASKNEPAIEQDKKLLSSNSQTSFNKK